MALRIGIYDLFTYTVPGFIYSSIGFYLLFIFNQFSINLEKLTTVHFLLLCGIAYLLGIIFDPIADIVLYKLLNRKNYAQIAISDMKNRYPEIKINFKKEHWPVALAYLYKQNIDWGNEIEILRALYKMLRNVSFAFMVFSVTLSISYLSDLSTHSLLLYSIISLVLAIISLLHARKFNKWFYSTLFESVIASQIDMSEYIKPKKNISK